MDFGGECAEAVEVILAEEVERLLRADARAADLCVDVADDHVGDADVMSHEVVHDLNRLAALIQAGERDAQAFFVNLMHAILVERAADVGHMRDAGSEADAANPHPSPLPFANSANRGGSDPHPGPPPLRRFTPYRGGSWGEEGHDDGDVGLVADANPRIVGDEDVTGADVCVTSAANSDIRPQRHFHTNVKVFIVYALKALYDGV